MNSRTQRGAALAGPAALIGFLLIASNLRAALTSVGPVLDDISRELRIDAVTAPVLISVPVIAFAICSPFAPPLARRFGIERTLGGTLLLLAVAIVGRSLPVPGFLWIGTALLGAAIAMINVLLPALLKRDFPGRIGPLTGLYSAVQSVFAAVAAGIAVPLAALTAAGWRLSLGIWGALAVVALLVFLPQLRRRTLPGDATAVLPRIDHRYRSPWTTPLGWQVTVFMGMQSTVFYSLITWWPTIDRDNGISAEGAGVNQFLFQIAGIAGSLGAAALLARLPDQRLLIAGAAAVTMLGVGGELLMPVFAPAWSAIVGAGGGASIVTALSLFGLRSNSPGQAAALSGMAQSMGYLIAAAGPVLLGLLHAATGGWTASLAVLLGVIVVQLVAGLFAGRPTRLPV
ncbi:MAG: Major facilitator superfamily, ral substrate transporter [Naasia sp.]|nr:Major facilitator superfamily, ral substrate transporter [Naasia sp.]